MNNLFFARNTYIVTSNINSLKNAGYSAGTKPEELNDKIEKMTAMLSPQGWILSGYLGIAAQWGEFYRTAHEIEIAVPEEKLECLVNNALGSNYSLFSRKLMFHKSKTTKVDIYARTTPAEILSENAALKEAGPPKKEERIKNRNLRLVRLSSLGKIAPHKDILDYIDLEVYYSKRFEIKEPAVTFIFTPDKSTALEKNQFEQTSFYKLKDGKKIEVASIDYIEANSHNLNSLDKEIIKKLRSVVPH